MGARGLGALMDLVAPPADPSGAPFDWSAVEAQLGTALPHDYKAYCDAYGHGRFYARWSLEPLSPGHPHPMFDLLGTTFRDWLADDESAAEVPYPQPGGLLPFASTESQQVIWWRTGGPPDSWPLALEWDTGDFEEMPVAGVTELLAQTVRGRGPLGWEAGSPGSADEVDPPQFWPDRPGHCPGVRRRPHVVTSSGHGSDGVHVTLDLGGALPGTRQELVDEFLARAPRWIRSLIVGVQVKRSEEILHLRHRAAIPVVRAAVQAFANRVDRQARR